MKKPPASQEQPLADLPVTHLRLTPAFKWVFLSVITLTLLSLAVSVYLVNSMNASEDARRLIETCSTTYKLGFGAIVGLVGGKAIQ